MAVPSRWQPEIMAPTMMGKLVICLKHWKEWFITKENTDVECYIGANGLVADPADAVNFAGSGPQGPVGPQGPAGPQGIQGATGSQGAIGPAGINAFGSPNARTLSLATAYQATNNTKPAVVTVNLTSTAALSLAGGTTNTAQVVIGATNAVASGTGTVIGQYANTLTGTLVIGLAINTTGQSPITFALPTGYFFAIRQTAGSITISSAFDQSVG